MVRGWEDADGHIAISALAKRARELVNLIGACYFLRAGRVHSSRCSTSSWKTVVFSS